MHVGFTGTQNGWTTAQSLAVYQVLSETIASGFIVMHNGDCIGSDAAAGKLFKRLGGHLVIHPPLVSKKRTYLPGDEIRPIKPYLVRNRNIVNESSCMIATPGEMVEQRRSGTWATIRYAQKRRKPLTIIFPDGTVKHENFPEPGPLSAFEDRT